MDRCNKSPLTIKRMARIAIFASILFIQEEALSFIPNVQFTQVLIAVYYFGFGLLDTSIIILIHVLLDNLVIGSFNLMYTPAMLIGWLTLPLILHLFRNVKNKYVISAVVGLHGIIYSWCFVAANAFIYEVPLLTYLIPDIPFELILVINGFLTTYLLFEPLTKVLKSKAYIS